MTQWILLDHGSEDAFGPFATEMEAKEAAKRYLKSQGFMEGEDDSYFDGPYWLGDNDLSIYPLSGSIEDAERTRLNAEMQRTRERLRELESKAMSL